MKINDIDYVCYVDTAYGIATVREYPNIYHTKFTPSVFGQAHNIREKSAWFTDKGRAIQSMRDFIVEVKKEFFAKGAHP